ncbi:hypothetical protein MMC18_005957 [Xylographa bjoerkii]|nr:hypothetical protein [Xylographa bjoerkii]
MAFQISLRSMHNMEHVRFDLDAQRPEVLVKRKGDARMEKDVWSNIWELPGDWVSSTCHAKLSFNGKEIEVEPQYQKKEPENSKAMYHLEVDGMIVKGPLILREGMNIRFHWKQSDTNHMWRVVSCGPKVNLLAQVRKFTSSIMVTVFYVFGSIILFLATIVVGCVIVLFARGRVGDAIEAIRTAPPGWI